MLSAMLVSPLQALGHGGLRGGTCTGSKLFGTCVVTVLVVPKEELKDPASGLIEGRLPTHTQTFAKKTNRPTFMAASTLDALASNCGGRGRAHPGPGCGLSAAGDRAVAARAELCTVTMSWTALATALAAANCGGRHGRARMSGRQQN
jgi:hypothetical protein